MSLQAAIERIQYHAGQVSGVQSAPDDPQAAIVSNNTFSITLEKSGEMGLEAANTGRDIHTLETAIWYQTGSTEDLHRRAEGALEAFADKLRADPTLNGAVDTILSPITYTAGFVTDGDNSRAWVLTITTRVKIRRSY